MVGTKALPVGYLKKWQRKGSGLIALSDENNYAKLDFSLLLIMRLNCERENSDLFFLIVVQFDCEEPIW